MEEKRKDTKAKGWIIRSPQGLIIYPSFQTKRDYCIAWVERAYHQNWPDLVNRGFEILKGEFNAD